MTLSRDQEDARAESDPREIYYQAGFANLVGILANLALAALKITAGILGKSSAVLADGFHTLSDLISSGVVQVGLVVARRKPDREHPYGHGKAESIAAKLVSVILFLVGLGILLNGIRLLFKREVVHPTFLAVWAAMISILVKELLYQYKIRKGRALSSSSLTADAWHHRSDALSSIVALIGVVGAQRYPAFDAAGAIGVSVIIIAVAVGIFLKTSNELMDACADDEKFAGVREISEAVEGVLGVETLRIRKSGLHFFVDIHIEVDPAATVLEGHEIARAVRDAVRAEMSSIADVLVHVEPHGNVRDRG